MICTELLISIAVRVLNGQLCSMHIQTAVYGLSPSPLVASSYTTQPTSSVIPLPFSTSDLLSTATWQYFFH